MVMQMPLLITLHFEPWHRILFIVSTALRSDIHWTLEIRALVQTRLLPFTAHSVWPFTMAGAAHEAQ